MLRGLLIMLQRISAQRILHDEAPDSLFGLTHASEDTLHEHSPEALSARLDAAERALDARQALRRVSTDVRLHHLADQ